MSVRQKIEERERVTSAVKNAEILYKLTDNGEKISAGVPLQVGFSDARNVQSFVEAKEIIPDNTEVSTALKEKHGVKCG